MNADLIKNVVYFSQLDERELDELASQSVEISLPGGETLIRESEACEGLYLLEEGSVKISRISSEGREQVLTVIHPGQSFNDVPVFDNGLNPATAMALEPSKVVMVPKETIKRLMRENSNVAEGMLRVFASRLRGLTMLVADLTHLDVTGRIAKLLLTCYASSERTTVRIGQQDIAAMVGSTREVAARALRTLEEQGGIVRQGREIEIVSTSTLENILEESAR